RPPTPPLFPYPTLFRSHDIATRLVVEPAPVAVADVGLVAHHLVRGLGQALTAELDARVDEAFGAFEPERQPEDEVAELARRRQRSEEHTSELQSRENLV